jgi:TfoX/Sxy family transcriptional regulator of competence genes
MRIVLENNIIKDIIKTLSQFGQVNYRMITDGVEFYRAGKLFGKLYNEQLYLLYKADYLTEVSLKDKNNLQLILGIAYLIAGVS